MKITLRAARVNVGLTVKEAAKELKVSYGTMWRWENEPQVIPTQKMAQMCELYHVKFEELNLNESKKNNNWSNRDGKYLEN